MRWVRLRRQVPEQLAAYCRERVHVRMHPEDAEMTEIFMLDQSCLPFLCINTLKQHAQQIAALSVCAHHTGASEPAAPIGGSPAGDGRVRAGAGTAVPVVAGTAAAADVVLKEASLGSQAWQTSPTLEVEAVSAQGISAAAEPSPAAPPRGRVDGGSPSLTARVVESSSRWGTWHSLGWLLLLSAWGCALSSLCLETVVAISTNPVRFQPLLSPFASRLSSYDAAIGAMVSVVVVSTAVLPACSRRWLVTPTVVWGVGACLLLAAKRVMLYSQYISASVDLAVASPVLATAAVIGFRMAHRRQVRMCVASASASASSSSSASLSAAATTRKGATSGSGSQPSWSSAPARLILVAACILSQIAVGYVWLARTFGVPFTRVHYLPTDAATCAIERCPVEGEGAPRREPCIEFLDGVYPYRTWEAARDACSAAGCTGLASTVDLARAWYPAVQPDYAGYSSFGTPLSHAEQDPGRCAYGWVADEGSEVVLWMATALRMLRCGPRGFSSKLTSGRYGGGGAYCVGCPNLDVCPIASPSSPPEPGRPPHPPDPPRPPVAPLSPPCGPPMPPSPPSPPSPPTPPASLERWTRLESCGSLHYVGDYTQVSSPIGALGQDGRHFKLGMQTCVPLTAKAAVRCCGVQSATDAAPVSISVCAEALTTIMNASERRLLLARTGDGSQATFADAAAECSAQGGRLCTLKELTTTIPRRRLAVDNSVSRGIPHRFDPGGACGTGCLFDPIPVWANHSCA